MIATPRRRSTLARVVRRPWPWVLRYVGALVPATIAALLLMVPLRRWFRLPVAIEALETRSLDLLFDVLRAAPAQGAADGLLWLAGLLLVPLAWLVLRFVWLWLEGATLTTYAAEEPPTVRGFARAGFRWLGSFILIGLLVAVALGIIIGLAVLLALLGRRVWVPLNTAVVVVGLLLGIGALLFGELARVAAVVADDTHALRAFGRAARLLRKRALPVLGLIVGTLIARGLLFVAQRGVTATLPLSWWAATLVIQQVIQIAITGVGLLRRAGEVGLALEVESTPGDPDDQPLHVAPHADPA